jgi:hypothetical protein
MSFLFSGFNLKIVLKYFNELNEKQLSFDNAFYF